MQALPIHDHFIEITELLKKHQVILVAGETGSGKSTQLPQLCHKLFSLPLSPTLSRKEGGGIIGHTQPRRIAAKTIAARIAEEMKTSLGELVGYQMRFNEALSPQTQIKVMTDGILLAETHDDPLLKRYHTLIIDEAHERSLNIDFILGYLKKILPKRPDLKVIITSATLDYERLAKHFNAPVVLVEGRTFPISMRYLPLSSKNKESRDVLHSGLCNAITSLSKEDWGDILVFLPTEREIREYRKKLAERFNRYEVLPLYARLPLSSQQKIFHPGNQPRIILATNVAETSLTVPNVRYVIDSGLARVSRFNAKLKIQRLPIEAISQANAKQRAGRAGRTSEGVCIRLYEEEDLINRPAFLEPELLRTNLAAVILLMLKLNLGDIRDFPFIDPPSSNLIHEGYKELFALQAIDEDRKLTPLGRKMGAFPIDPRLARMIVAGSEFRVLPELLVIVSNLTTQDPREYPEEFQEKARTKHQRYLHPDSEFLTILNLWHMVHQDTSGFSNNQFKRYCETHFLSHNRMREWQALHHELVEIVSPSLPRKLRLLDLSREGKGDFNYQAIHQALLTGSLHFIGMYDDEKQCYRGAENKLFQIFPGSSLSKKKFKWMMAESLMETQKVYARIVARIEANWLEPLSRHLAKKQYSEPMYDVKMDEVIAYETLFLYSLPIVTRRKTLFAKKNPTLAREVFIREGLIPTQNEETKASLHTWEAKLRRLGIALSDEEWFSFYNERIPADAVSFKTLHLPSPSETTVSSVSPARREVNLQYDVTDRLAPFKHLAAQYPDEIHGCPVRYIFDPLDDEDGATLRMTLKGLLHMPDTTKCQTFALVNEDDQTLARSKSLSALKKHFSQELNKLANEVASPYGDETYQDWTFDDLPDSLDHSIPALTPVENGVQIKLYHDSSEAQEVQQQGILTLLKKNFNKELKALKSDPKCLNEIGKLAFIQDKAGLTAEFLDYVLLNFFDQQNIDLSIIRTQKDFFALLALKPKFYTYHQEILKWLTLLTAPLLDIRVQLKGLSHKQGLAASVADLQDQFLELCQPHFWVETPREYLKRYPTYLKGMQLRISRLINNPEREIKLFAEFQATCHPDTAKGRRQDPKNLKWIIQEYRLSLFTQELKTLMPISTKKMHELFANT